MAILPNRIQRLGFLFGVCCVAWVNVAIGMPFEALGDPRKTMLVLYGDPLITPADRMTEQGLTVALSSRQASDLEVFSEYLDLTHFPAARYGEDIARYLRARYGTRKLDVLIALTNTALQFVLDRRDELFPGVPGIRTRWLDKLPLQSELDLLRHLPPDSVVLYIPMQQDGSGKSVSAFEVARQVAEASSVPVYGVSRPQLQQGIIGGALLDFQVIQKLKKQRAKAINRIVHR